MDMLSKLKDDVKQFRKNRDSKSVQILQTVIGELDTKQKNGEVIDDPKVYKILETFIKNNNMTISMTQDSTRIDSLNFENDLLSKYLPINLSESEIDLIISDNNFGSIKEGMDYFKSNYAGRYDGGLVSRKLKK